MSPPPKSSIKDEVFQSTFYNSDVTVLMPLSKVVTELQTTGYATVRHLSTCITYCRAHIGWNKGCEGKWLPTKEGEREGGGYEEDGGGKMRKHFSFQLFCTNMNSQWNVWRSRSMGFRKFVRVFFFLLLSTYSLVNGKWAMRLGRGEDDELERVSEKRERKKKTEDRLSGGLGLSRVPYQLTERPRQREWEEREERDLYLL